MKITKLNLKHLLLLLCSFAFATNASAQTTPTYQIEMKNKFHSKHHRDKLWGVVYPNDDAADVSGKDVREFPYCEKFYSYDKSVAGYKDPSWSETNDKWRFVKQFAISKGVVYWIKPTENVINYWNTVTGEVGAFQPLNEDSQPLELINKVGYGSITQDWKGNLIFAYYTAQDQAIQGYGTIDGRNTAYGTLVPRYVRLTNMSQDGNCHLEWIQAPYKSYEEAVALGIKTSRNPNIPKSDINPNTSTPTGTEVVTHYLTASGDLYDKHWSGSSVFSGYSGGYVFEAYNNVVFANMFADGKYANWYLNYKVQHRPTPGASYVTTTPNSLYLSESVYRECDVLEYFWSSPGVAYAEFSHPGGDFLNDGVQYDLLGNLNQYYAYTYGSNDYLPDYTLDGTDVALTQTGYDLTAGLESDSIKGHRVLVNSSWMNRVPNQWIGSPYNTFVRDGSIDVRTCAYDGGYDADGVDSDGNPRQWLGKPTRTYTKVATGYGYRNIKSIDPVGGIAVNCWNELERVNNNVFALYTHVPGQGFSKYFITAVEQDNPVTLKEITRLCYSPSKATTDPEYVKLGGVKVKLTWTAQEHDRETLNRYEVWYKTYKRDADKNLVSDCGDTWKKAGVASIDYSDGNYTDNNRLGVFYHELTYGGANTPDDPSDDYDLTYEYMIIPIYDASDHRGTEAIYSQKVPSAAPRYPATAKLSQITEGEGANKKYSFNLKLDVTAHQNMSIPYSEALVNDPSVPNYWVTIDADSDEERNTIANALRNATSLVAVDENGNELTDVTVTVQDNATTNITANNCYHYPIVGYNVWVQHANRRVSYGGTNKFPSLVWKNVDPNISYKVKVYCNAMREYNFIGSPRTESTMVVPGASTTMTTAQVQPLAGEYDGMANDNDIMPMGAKLRHGSDEVTNPVTLMNANTLGTRGSVINPLAVTDEVLSNWTIQYTYHILQNGEVINSIELHASDVDVALYSNETNVAADVLGLPIAKTDWDIHTTMGLSEEQKKANENITKQGYDVVATAANQFSTKVDVTYTRKTNSIIASNTEGTISLIPMPSESPFNALRVDNADEVSALFRRTSSHYDLYGPENKGYYYKNYYDAGIQWSWSEYEDILNKYIGYHAVTQTECVGHPENESTNTWTKYYAANVLSNYYVDEYNKTLINSGLSGFMCGIGYDGSSSSDWSALATVARKLPMTIHYVWRGDEWVTTDEERQKIKMSVILTADYPMIEGVTLKVNEYNANANYSMVLDAVSPTDAENTSLTKSMITVPTTFNNFSAKHAPTVTGVEGIITEACGGWNLYPNPVGETFTLQAPMIINEVKIFTMDGQLVKVVKDCDDSSIKVNVEELPQGLYIVHTLGVAKIMIKQ